MLQVPCVDGGRYHSRAVCEEQTGSFPLQKVTSDGTQFRKQGGTVEYIYASPLNIQG